MTGPDQRSGKRRYEIDGARFASLDEFYEEISNVLIPGAEWGRNLNAFNDILRGGFGTPVDGFVLCWRNAAVSRRRLGYQETIRVLTARLETCHSANVARVEHEIEDARHGRGPTIFDELVEIIRDHGPGGQESEDSVDLELDDEPE